MTWNFESWIFYAIFLKGLRKQILLTFEYRFFGLSVLGGRTNVRNGLLWPQMTLQIAGIDILHIWGRISHIYEMSVYGERCKEKLSKIAQNRHFHDFWLSILEYVLTLGPYVFGSVERMLWSVSSPNVLVRYLITTPFPAIYMPRILDGNLVVLI